MIEYKVRPVTRWAITRYEESNGGASSGTVCEVSSMDSAEHLANALADRDGGKLVSFAPENLADVPALLQRIVAQIQDGSLKASTGVLTLRANCQRRPAVFGFGSVCDAAKELDLATKELIRLGAMKAK